MSSPDVWVDALADPQVALEVGVAWLSSRSWLHRRVDHVEFRNEATIRRATSLDFTVPDSAPAVGPGGTLRLVPLALLAKAPLIAFDLRDAAGAALPMFTSAQNAVLATTLLISWAESTVDDALDGPIREDLTGIARGSAEHADAVLRRWRSDPPDRQRDMLLGDAAFMDIVRWLAYNFLLLVAVPGEVGSRQVVKLGYDTILERRDPGGRQLLGWAPTTFRTSVTVPAGAVASYHLEVAVPDGVDIDALAVRDRRGRVVGQGLLAPPRAHVVVAGQPPFADLEAEVVLAPQRRGWLQSAAVAAILSSLLLVAVWWRRQYVFAPPIGVTTVIGHPDWAATIVLATAGLWTGVVGNPGPNALAARLVAGLRLLATVSAVLPIGAAAASLLAPDPWRGAFLGVAAVLSVVCATLLAAAAWSPTRRPKTLARPQ